MKREPISDSKSAVNVQSCMHDYLAASFEEVLESDIDNGGFF